MRLSKERLRLNLQIIRTSTAPGEYVKARDEILKGFDDLEERILELKRAQEAYDTKR